MEDAIWNLRHQSQVLQDFRRDIEGLWDDEAAKQLNLRYLNPHEADSGDLNAALHTQNEALQNAQDRFVQANDHAINAEKLSFSVVESLEFVQQETTTAREFQEQSREQIVQAKALVPKVVESVKAATAVCEGVPRT